MIHILYNSINISSIQNEGIKTFCPTEVFLDLRLLQHLTPWDIFGLKFIRSFCPLGTHFDLEGIRIFWTQKSRQEKLSNSQRFEL